MSLIPFILDLADELHEFSRCLANGIDINDFGFGLYTGTDQQQPQQHQQQPQQQQQQQQQPQTSPRRSRTSSFSSFWMPSKRHHPYNRIKTACCAKSGEEAVAVTPEKSDAGSSSIGGTPGKSASYSVVNKNGFQVSMNVKQFAPNELSVKTIDNCIVVEGRHDDKEDGHGVISRHFVRKYMLPKGYDPNDVLSTLSSDGILTVKAPPPPPPTAKNDEPNERIIEIQPTPGPTPVLVVSAKDTPAKETSKKLATTPSARLECQLPEKRQKLDLPPEPEPEESAETPAPIPPATATVTETESASASVAVAGAEVESNDVDMEKSDEQINEVVLKQTEQQQTSDVEGPENEVEKKAEIIEQKEKEQKQKQGKIGTETEKKKLDEYMSDSNGDSKIAGEKMEESSSVTEATEEVTEKTNETPAAAKVEESVEESNVTKMEVDDDGDNDNDGHDNVEEKTDNTEVVVATIKTADSETKTAVKAAAGADSAKKNTDKEKTNNTETSSSSSSSNTSTTTTTTTTNNNNNTSTNSNSTTTTTITNNSSTDSVTENSANDVKDGNGVVTGDIPVDIPKSTDSDAANTATAKTKASADSSKAESVAEGEQDTETAVLGTDKTTTKKNIIDDVALLKAATADPADITGNAEENVILTESMDGITTTTNPTNANTNTTTTTVDNVECSLFAKKSHLGNGNNTTATPLVGTEEMAN